MINLFFACFKKPQGRRKKHLYVTTDRMRLQLGLFFFFLKMPFLFNPSFFRPTCHICLSSTPGGEDLPLNPLPQKIPKMSLRWCGPLPLSPLSCSHPPPFRSHAFLLLLLLLLSLSPGSGEAAHSPHPNAGRSCHPPLQPRPLLPGPRSNLAK